MTYQVDLEPEPQLYGKVSSHGCVCSGTMLPGCGVDHWYVTASISSLCSLPRLVPLINPLHRLRKIALNDTGSPHGPGTGIVLALPQEKEEVRQDTPPMQELPVSTRPLQLPR